MIHLESFWNLLNFRRVFLMTIHDQDAFENLEDKYRVTLDGDYKTLKAKLCRQKQFVNTVNLFYLLNIIYKLIVYKLACSNGTDNEIAFEELNFFDFLSEVIDENGDNKENKVQLKEYDFEGLKLGNVNHIWKLLVSIYYEIKVKA